MWYIIHSKSSIAFLLCPATTISLIITCEYKSPFENARKTLIQVRIHKGK
jgi:hypothetical protein